MAAMCKVMEDMSLLRGSALNCWAGRKTRAHQTAGKTPAVFKYINIEIALTAWDRNHMIKVHFKRCDWFPCQAKWEHY